MLQNASIDVVCSDLHVKPHEVHKSSIIMISTLQICFRLVPNVT